MKLWKRPAKRTCGKRRLARGTLTAPAVLAFTVLLGVSGCAPGSLDSAGSNPAKPSPGDQSAERQPAPSSSPSSSQAPGTQPSAEQRDRQGTDNSPLEPRSDFQLPQGGGTPKPDQRGLLQKNFGELAGVVTADGSNKRLVNFAVASITVDYRCQTGTSIKPSNGYFIAVELWIEALPDLASSKSPFFGVSPKDFDLQGVDGSNVRQPLDTRAAHACLDNGLGLPARITPGQKIRGLLVLDSPINAGALILSQKSTEGPGWIWPLPPAAASVPSTG